MCVSFIKKTWDPKVIRQKFFKYFSKLTEHEIIDLGHPPEKMIRVR